MLQEKIVVFVDVAEPGQERRRSGVVCERICVGNNLGDLGLVMSPSCEDKRNYVGWRQSCTT